MTVQELIDALATCHPDTPVLVAHESCCYATGYYDPELLPMTLKETKYGFVSQYDRYERGKLSDVLVIS